MTAPSTHVQATCVAFYGEKPTALKALLQRCQDEIRKHLPHDFIPSDMEQIHATLVGLERVAGTMRDNRFFHEHRGERRPMDLASMRELVLDALPIRFRFGGFAPEDAPFESRGARPWERSCSISGGLAVLIGWPVDGCAFPDSLDRLRRSVQRAGVLHRYHASQADIDNDLYLRLGRASDASSDAATAVRTFLESHPLEVEVDATSVRLAAYTDESLPGASTQSWPLRSCDLATLWDQPFPEA